jgi:hypothetical protein
MRVNGTSGGTLANDSYNSSDNARKILQVRHDYNFVALGVPGLTLMNRYISGDNVHTGSITDGKEWGRESELGYTVQSGALKNLNLKWRNSTMRRDYSNNEFDEPPDHQLSDQPVVKHGLPAMAISPTPALAGQLPQESSVTTELAFTSDHWELAASDSVSSGTENHGITPATQSPTHPTPTRPGGTWHWPPECRSNRALHDHFLDLAAAHAIVAAARAGAV